MKKILLCLTLAICFVACKKKSEDIPAVTPLEPYSLQAYLKQTGYDQTVNEFNAGGLFFERGTVYETFAAGSIKGVRVNLPAANNNLMLYIWRADNMQLITSKVVNYATPNVEVTFSFASVIFTQPAKFCVSYVTPFTNKRKRADGASATYPVKFSNLNIVSHNDKQISSLNAREYPTNIVGASYYGDVGIVFE